MTWASEDSHFMTISVQRPDALQLMTGGWRDNINKLNAIHPPAIIYILINFQELETR